MFVVETDDSDFMVFECFDINEFNIGDQILGELDKMGPVTIVNGGTQKNIDIIIRKTSCTLTLAMNIAHQITNI